MAVTAFRPPRYVKLILEASVSCADTDLESWCFTLSFEGNNCSWPGVIFPVRAKNKNGNAWLLEFSHDLKRRRTMNFGSDVLSGVVTSKNDENRPVPREIFEAVLGAIHSAFDINIPVDVD